MRTILALSLALATLSSAATASAAISGREAKPKIVAALKASSKIVDKRGTFRTQLGGKAGDKLRPFTANNRRFVILPTGGPGFENKPLGGARIQTGGIATGTINMKTERVTIKRYMMPR